ncbi:GNAT family N-acetyltransferase [Modestobacter italicus]|uniref:GNAT family N-acetyltransferase n=1 Tax=Modestobacter italicus (strain DSM 44449 / CECT 9708 / BC 501) TaxID=2732864 RepID=UPI001C96FC1D|nr:GNAT family N-acetyltransferase [Modestobacter italicus]
MSGVEPVVRVAEPDDVPAICRFGAEHVPPHYTPLIGAEAAAGQVRDWWDETSIGAAVAAGLVIIAEAGAQLVGVAQRGRYGDDHVVWKLYVHPEHRSRGLGRQLLDAVIGQLPDDADRLCIEHFAANERAGSFYEREGFPIERVEPSRTGDTALAVVWRARPLGRQTAQAPRQV